MKAVRLIAPGRPLELMEMPIPISGADDVLIRVKAAGICHSDAHYRAGKSRVHPLPLTLGHEVAGVVEQTGTHVHDFTAGDRVCIHYLATCGTCGWCSQGEEQFCGAGQMIGKYRDGGYAEYIVMPARSVFKLPEAISFEHGAIMMCSSATSWHALNKARQRAGESVAIFGSGGLGFSAVQLARARGASQVFAVDINAEKLAMAATFGAVPINAAEADPVAQIHEHTKGRGVDVAIELIGLPQTMEQSVRSLAIKGRAALVGIMAGAFAVAPYHELINKEAEIVGVSDHLAAELPDLLAIAQAGKLDLRNAITRTLPLEADAINGALDRLETFQTGLREVITP